MYLSPLIVHPGDGHLDYSQFWAITTNGVSSDAQVCSQLECSTNATYVKLVVNICFTWHNCRASGSLRIAVCMVYLSLPFYFEPLDSLKLSFVSCGQGVVGIALSFSVTVCLRGGGGFIPFTLMCLLLDICLPFSFFSICLILFF